jgi:hypothetical protein
VSPSFPHTSIRSLTSWSNYTGTIAGRSIPVFCVPEGGTTVDVLKLHGDAIRAIVGHCLESKPSQQLRTLGSAWSFSNVLEPGRVVIDPANLNFMQRIPKEHWSATYLARADLGGDTPVFAEGGTAISSINRRLGRDLGLALKTSGAGDGHRIGGCIATGTHGSAIDVGALHDTVLALYLVVGRDQALLVQRGGAQAPFKDSAAAWLQSQTGIPTKNVADDTMFHAAQVSLGSLGFVFGVVLNCTKLYQFRIRRSKYRPGNPTVMNAIKTLDTQALHPDILKRPYHFDVVMHPYPHGDEAGLFVTLMWKESAANVKFASPVPAIPRTGSDTMGFIASIAQALSGPIVGSITLAVLQELISKQLSADAAPAESFLFPGQAFGPTTLPPGTGASTEIVVNHDHAVDAIDAVFDVLQTERARGNFLLGCVAARFVPKTDALLGMNQAKMNCFIELPSIRNHDVLQIYESVWTMLEQRNIPFTCHWGQLNGLTPARVQNYFGAKAAQWSAARRSLLVSDEAMHVFAASILRDAGL